MPALPKKLRKSALDNAGRGQVILRRRKRCLGALGHLVADSSISARPTRHNKISPAYLNS